MSTNQLKYQPVLYPDGTVSIHETIVDSDGNIQSASYEAVRLESTSVGGLVTLLRQTYSALLKIKPITEEELEAMMYGVETSEDLDEEDNVIDLVDYFSNPSYFK